MSTSTGSGHGSGSGIGHERLIGNRNRNNGELSLMQDLQNKYAFLENLFSKFWKSIIQSNSNLKLRLRNVKWKNAKAKPGCAYQPTEVSLHTHAIERDYICACFRSSRWPM